MTSLLLLVVVVLRLLAVLVVVVTGVAAPIHSVHTRAEMVAVHGCCCGCEEEDPWCCCGCHCRGVVVG